MATFKRARGLSLTVARRLWQMWLRIVPATRHVLAWLDWKRLYAWTAQRRHYRRCTQPAGLQLPAAV